MDRAGKSVSGRELLLVGLGLAVMAAVIFRVVLPWGTVLLTTDDGIGDLALRKAALPRGFLGWWVDVRMAGLPNVLQLNWTNLLLWLLPLEMFTDWIHAIDLCLASFFFHVFLRRRGMGVWAALVGVLTVFWLGTNFTLTFAGHLGKFGVLMFAALYLLLADLALERGSAVWSLLAGGAAGGMFLEQADVALFFALFLGPYTLFRLWERKDAGTAVWIRVLVPAALAAGLLAARPLLVGYQTAVKGVAAVEESRAQKWNFVTQWSWPPEESIDFIAPGFMGWRSGEPEGPYWGRMGRSAGWEKTHQGFMNFKLENQYIGALPIVLALLGVILWIRRKGGGSLRREVFFWSWAAAGALLLSFGKYFPLYRIVFMLPVISSIRNPNKFLHIFQLAVGVMAAAGLQEVTAGAGEQERGAVKRFVGVVVGAGGILMVAALLTASSRAGLAAGFSERGFGRYGEVIAGNIVGALVHGGLLTLLAGGVVAAGLLKRDLPRRVRGLLAPLCGLVVALDAAMLARHYVTTQDIAPVRDNPVARFLDSLPGPPRTALVNQSGPYNYLLTYVFPFHRIPCLNVTQMPRMPKDYEAMLKQGGRNPVRLWRLFGVEYVLGPVQMWQQIQSDPALKDQFDLVYAYNIEVGGPQRILFIPATKTSPGRHCILRLRPPAGRFVLVDRWSQAPSGGMPARLFAHDFHALQEVLLEPGARVGREGRPDEGGGGKIDIISCRPGDIRLKVSTTRPAFLRLAERRDADWKAVVDGRGRKPLGCDYLFQGVYVKPGVHEVRFAYRPPVTLLLLELAGLLAMAAAGVWLAAGFGRR